MDSLAVSRALNRVSLFVREHSSKKWGHHRLGCVHALGVTCGKGLLHPNQASARVTDYAENWFARVQRQSIQGCDGHPVCRNISAITVNP